MCLLSTSTPMRGETVPHAWHDSTHLVKTCFSSWEFLMRAAQAMIQWYKMLCKHKQNSENGPLFQFCWVSLCIWTSCQYQSRWVFVNSGLRWNIAKFDFRQIFMFHDWAAFSLSCMSLIAWCIFILCKIFSIIIGNMISLTSSEMPSPTQF